MSHSIQPVQGVSSQQQVTALPPKPQQTAAPSATPQDAVTISSQSQQALAGADKTAGGGNPVHGSGRH